MPCVTYRDTKGSALIMCSRSRRKNPMCTCGKPSTRQCDYPNPRKKSGTCDRNLCEGCAVQVATSLEVGGYTDSVDHCPTHAQCEGG